MVQYLIHKFETFSYPYKDYQKDKEYLLEKFYLMHEKYKYHQRKKQ